VHSLSKGVVEIALDGSSILLCILMMVNNHDIASL
jgi:hypothetical protein